MNLINTYKNHFIWGAIALFVVSLLFNGYWLLQIDRAKYFDAGSVALAKNIFEQAKNGDVSLTLDGKLLVLTPKK